MKSKPGGRQQKESEREALEILERVTERKNAQISSGITLKQIAALQEQTVSKLERISEQLQELITLASR